MQGKKDSEFHTACFSLDDASDLNLKSLAAAQSISISACLRHPRHWASPLMRLLGWGRISARRFSAAVATSREGHRKPISGREVQHRRWGREQPRMER
jgi:hypothetical protein